MNFEGQAFVVFHLYILSNAVKQYNILCKLIIFLVVLISKRAFTDTVYIQF